MNGHHIMLTKVLKVGNSCAIVVPKPILGAVGLRRGDQVVFEFDRFGYISFRKVSQSDLLPTIKV